MNHLRRIVLGLLVGAGGLTSPVEAALAPFVRSLQPVTITILDGQVTGSASLSAGTVVADCVPFATMRATGADNRGSRALIDISLAATPPRVIATRADSIGSLDLQVYVVEFIPSFVRVQQGTFAMANGQTGPVSASITPVDLSRAALVSYYRTAESSGDFRGLASAGWFSAVDQLSWRRDFGLDAIDGHYYVFEALSGEFTVRPVTWSVPVNAAFSDGTIPSAVPLDKSFVVASYRTSYSGTDPREGAVSVSMRDSTTLRAERQFTVFPGGNEITEIRAFVVTFGTEGRVLHGSLAYPVQGGLQTISAAIPRVDLGAAMAWSPVGSPGPGYIQADANGGPQANTMFALLTLPNDTTVQGVRSESGFAGVGAGAGTFEVVEWVAGPTKADVVSLRATRFPDRRVLVEWATGFEVGNLGFHVYREEAGGERVCVTPSLVAGSALLAGGTTALRAGQSYAWWDEAEDGVYWLEEWDLSGERRWHGPAVPEPGRDRPLPARADAVAPAESGRPVLPARAALLAELGAAPAASRGTAQVGPSAISRPRRVERRSLPGRDASTRQWFIAGSAWARLAVREPGWYRVTREDLLAAGVPVGRGELGRARLFADGREVPLLVPREGRSVAGDAVEFFGDGAESPWSAERVYWLVPGRRSGLPVLAAHARAAGPSAATSFPFVVERKDRTVYFAALRNGEAENFFGPAVGPGPVDQTLSVHHLDPDAPVTLEVSLQGATAGTHRVGVELNGVRLGEVAFGDQALGGLAVPVPWGLVEDGLATVRLAAEGGPGDVSLVARVALTYGHTYTADGDALLATVEGGTVASLGGFSTPDIRVFDVTRPDAVQQLWGRPIRDGGAYAVRLAAPGAGPRTLLAVAAAGVLRPHAVEANRPSWWHRGDHRADLVIVAHASLLPSLGPLKAQREAQGLRVELVDVQDVYDESSFGSKTPHALRDFLRHARRAWAVAPRFALLVGDASVDPKNYLGLNGQDLVPTSMVDTAYLETASDDGLADFDGDGLAEIALGRLPARTPEEASGMVAKLLAWDNGARAGRVVLVTDANDEGNDFEGASAQVRGALPDSVEVAEVRRGLLGERARDALLEELDRGADVVDYLGHGSTQLWRGGLLTADAARNLAHERHPVFAAMTCLSGYFVNPLLESLAEALLANPSGGAVGVWASSGLTELLPQATMNEHFFRALYGGGERPLRLGEAILLAKARTADPDVRRTWVLFGDPTTPLR